MEVLVISAQNGNGMQFPKVFIILFILNLSEWLFVKCLDWAVQGGWEINESMEQAALRETIEEAGVMGNIQVSKITPFFLTFILYELK